MNELGCGGGGENHRLLLTQLASYDNETEEKIFKDAATGKIFKSYSFTDRAILARSKIVLKQTLGRGTYSKVKQAYDLINLRPLAVKIIDCSKAPKDFQVWPRTSVGLANRKLMLTGRRSFCRASWTCGHA